MWAPGVLTYYGVLPSVIGVLGIVGLLGPVLSGFVMTALTECVAGVGDLLRRIVLWRVGIQWYLFAFLGLPAVMVLGTLLRPGALASFDISAQPISLSYLIAFVSMVAIGGPLMEEPGWTGFAQLRMKRLHGPLVGGLILGSFWGCGTCQGS